LPGRRRENSPSRIRKYQQALSELLALKCPHRMLI
jgi:hypothetical protein